MIFNQSHSRTFGKRCKNFTNKKGRKYLFSQELSVMMKASGRNLRSSKTTTNKTSTNKINRSTMKSGTAMENKKTTIKTLRSTSKKSDLMKIEMTRGKEEKEIVSRSKRKNTTGNRSTKRIILSSKRKANIPEGVKLKNKSSSFRQMSLKESFSNQEALSKRLRPRKESRNYCEDSVLQKTNIVSQEQKDVELENAPGVSDKLKLPVYKSVKLNEESSRNVSDIYDFKFDENDSKEKLGGKRKRRIVNRVGQKRVKKTKRTRQKKVPQVIVERLSSDVISLCTTKKIEDNNEQNHMLLPSINIVEKFEDDVENQNELPPPVDDKKFEAESNSVPNLETNHLPSTQAVSEDTKKHPNTIVSKSKIVSIENLNNNEVLLIDTPVKSKPDNFAPFRKTNVFCNRVKSHQENTINDSLISKSLSPIKKAFVNFDVGSPWRLSPINTFSQVKNLFQSTPQPRTLEILQSKIKPNTKDQAIKCLETVKKNDVSEIINEDINRQKICDKFNYINRKVGQVIRKFGTEITNLDNSVSINNNTVITEQYEEMASNKELRVSNKDLQNTIGTTSMDSSAFNATNEDKENAAPKSPSKSKKFLRKRLRKVTNTSSSPLHKKRHIKDKENLNMQSQPISMQTFSRNGTVPHAQEEKQEQSKEIFEPQPGPSGLQKLKSPNQKPLQQTNLNAFLNITEMPQSTRINTAHGIFCDAQSTPINGKHVKPIKTIADTKRMELDNAFGFNEDTGDMILDISPIYSDLTSNNVQDRNILKTNVKETKRISSLPMRYFPKEMKKDTVSKKVNAGENNEKGKEKENVVVEEPLPEKNRLIDTAAFSDTFDVLGEIKEVKNDSTDMPLFTDLEPTHFTEPPTRSYKRKRNVTYNFSESGSEEDEENNHVSERKRKKHGKLKKYEIRRMEEWVKSINETFQDIDHHELVVE
ncbi:uncharacterized protein LOC124432118 isoform X1 [Vespa crabro]|uniref:uncharacterized protein LOC124432118 isoform X1 n=2 Tax=Vespa crabro TaxID=7445 RepID=UPI001F0238A5|nr:uncharacterized protein LOC124432118 isoform X1 [Vespa crabro]